MSETTFILRNKAGTEIARMKGRDGDGWKFSNSASAVGEYYLEVIPADITLELPDGFK